MTKRYLIKIYNSDWTFKENVSENKVTWWVRFSQTINAWQGQFNLVISEKFNDLWIEKNDFVKIFVYDNNFNWKLIYTWVIESINRIYSQNIINYTCRWLWSLLNRVIFEYWWNKEFSLNKDPWLIIKDIITYFNNIYSWDWLNDSWVTNFWSNINIAFSYNNCFSAINNIVDSTNFYFIIKEDWTVVFKAKDINNTHSFIVWKNVNEINIVEDISNIKNKVILSYNWWYTTSEDVASQNNYWLFEILETRSDINDLSTANETANNIISEFKDPKNKITININNKYPIENIKPWDTVRVNNIEYSIDWIQIQRITYNSEEIVLELDEYDSIWEILNK